MILRSPFSFAARVVYEHGVVVGFVVVIGEIVWSFLSISQRTCRLEKVKFSRVYVSLLSFLTGFTSLCKQMKGLYDVQEAAVHRPRLFV